MDTYKLKNGRYIVAQFENGQYTSSDIKLECRFSGYVYTYGWSPDALASEGIRTYSSVHEALKANNACTCKKCMDEEKKRRDTEEKYFQERYL
jgi:hypothetical protein